ncbi:hypothetical protein CY34DRAFT_12689 [Suillus luteus UH-Slu-Lm8-n1]|uniref:CHAT domain-containing protein n=1 Tax=Suillus luteus UH-Slu-Lm8-n1 TaxID=930992 RepID=A0A0D0AJD8_9AGAM|nr:hypothetical protein CY34DRAFT_12689 [Suillus luteus UH-Slu-Lm8-n1]
MQTHKLTAGPRGVDYVINECNELPTDASDEGIHLRRAVLELCPLGHQLRPRALEELAQAVIACFDQHGNIDDLDTSIQLGRETVSLCPGGHADSDYYLNNLAVSLVSRLKYQGKPSTLDEVISLYEKALDNLGYQPLSRGSDVAPTWTFSELSKRLSDAQGSAGSVDPAAADRAAIQCRRLTEQWEIAVAEIRDLQAFSRFLLPPSYEDLQVAACQGPVIILIASQHSCSAIIVPTSGEPHHVPLPSVTLADLTNLKDRFATAIRYTSRMNPAESRMDLMVLLRIIWDEFMLPIVNVLEHVVKLTRRSRIWLCPTAAFTSIPLHAAHPFQTQADRSGKEPCLEDLYICSYTPTLSAGQPGAGKGKALLAVDSELELVRKLIHATANRTTISGDAATRAGALEALQKNTWVHLACHGNQDRTQPYNSHFVMKDEHLTLLGIMERDIPYAEFAFLSACYTAVGDEERPNEVIHLAAGLQFSRFRGVVGMLWEVDGAVAKHVVEAFYEHMSKDLKDGGVMDCTKAAWALNRATHAVKMKVPLEQKMVFIHIGV